MPVERGQHIRRPVLHDGIAAQGQRRLAYRFHGALCRRCIGTGSAHVDQPRRHIDKTRARRPRLLRHHLPEERQVLRRHARPHEQAAIVRAQVVTPQRRRRALATLLDGARAGSAQRGGHLGRFGAHIFRKPFQREGQALLPRPILVDHYARRHEPVRRRGLRPADALQHVVDRHREALAQARQRRQLERDVGHHAQCPLRPDKELGQVVARHVLDHGPPSADDTAVAQRCRHGEHIVAPPAIAHAQRAVDIRRQQPAHRCVGRRRGQRRLQAVPGQELRQLGQRHGRAHGDVEIVRRKDAHAGQLVRGK